MNAQRHSVRTFLGIRTCRWRLAHLILRTTFRVAFWWQKRWPLKRVRVPRGLTQPRTGRPLRWNTVCLEPLTADMLLFMILLNSVFSTPWAKFMTIDISNFYLNTPMTRYKYSTTSCVWPTSRLQLSKNICCTNPGDYIWWICLCQRVEGNVRPATCRYTSTITIGGTPQQTRLLSKDACSWPLETQVAFSSVHARNQLFWSQVGR